MLAHEALERGQPAFHLLERSVLFVGVLAVGLQAARDVLSLDRKRIAPCGVGVEVWVDASRRVELGGGRGKQMRGAGLL